jgi:hypothetical protein
MSHQPGRGPEDAVRALLEAASGDGPPTTDLLRQVRRRTRRRRALVPSLATLGTLGVVAAVAATATVTTPPAQASARELVAAAVSRTARDGYRVRVTGRKSGEPVTGITEGVFDPARRTGRMVAVAPDKGHVIILVRDRVYVQIPAHLVGRQPGVPKNARWILRGRDNVNELDVPRLAEFGRVALQDPQQALDWVRRAGDVREQGPASGKGWAGVRYAFRLAEGRWLVTGTVDVDRDGRVRRLELTSRVTDRAWAAAHGLGATAHSVLEFWDFGIRVRVSPPPANQVFRLQIPGPEELKARRARAAQGRSGKR